MYAVIRTGGKQYKVAPGEKLKVELLAADVGSKIVLGEVLMVGDGEVVRVGRPTVEGASVRAHYGVHPPAFSVSINIVRRR